MIPIIITWYAQTYVKGTHNERHLAAVVRISNSAIDYVENLDNRGELTISENASKGLQKLSTAGAWMEQELKGMGISMSNEEAQRWIASEFQNRVGVVVTVGKLGQLAGTSQASH
ncbi:MAG: hypothetical protein GY943_08100 [Chloroflexi bacterium]|nr:hypothetical protein [Chloroflexota bacterium]